jgi:hypothetical protein
MLAQWRSAFPVSFAQLLELVKKIVRQASTWLEIGASNGSFFR